MQLKAKDCVQDSAISESLVNSIFPVDFFLE